MREFERRFDSQEDFETCFQPYVPLKLIPVDEHPSFIYLDYLFNGQYGYQQTPGEYKPFSYRLHDTVVKDISTGINQMCCHAANKAVEIGADIEHVLFYQLCACKEDTHGRYYQDAKFFCPVPILMRVTSPVYKTSERVNIAIEIPDLSAASYVYGDYTNSGVGYYSLGIKMYSHGFCTTDYSERNETFRSWLADVITDCMVNMCEKRAGVTESTKDVNSK